MQNSFTTLASAGLHLFFPPPRKPLATAGVSTISIVPLPFPECRVVGLGFFNNSFSKNPPVSKSFSKVFGASQLKRGVLYCLSSARAP